MRRTALLAATAALPTVLAFTSGGTSATARAGFVIAACALLAVSAFTTSGPLVPRGTGARIALTSFAALTALTAASHAWTVDTGGWLVATHFAIGYVSLLYAATLQLTDRPAEQRLVEPMLAAGTVVVVGYGLLQRALSDVFSTTESVRAGGRLFTPIGYWNAEGLLAALGILLCARIAGDRSRPLALRVAVLASVPVLAVGLELSFSRVGIAAVAAGLLLLTLLDRAASRFQSLAAVLLAGAAGVLTTVPFSSLRAAETDAAAGAPWLGVLVIVCLLVAAAAHRWLPRFLDGERQAPPAVRRVLIGLVVAVVALPFATALLSRSDEGSGAFGASTTRLTATGSNRALYWEVAVHQFADRPLAGDGAGSFASAWLRHRTIDEKVVNAHSLWLETAAELGLAGLLLLLTTAAGVVLALRRSTDPGVVIGPAAVLLTWAVASSSDWHWQVPAVTAIAIILAGLALSSEQAGSSAG